eukprot:TRINITY_DN18459_c0_g1_i1.p1 TRINITY_DN18459_c0_g1~~TRINITY_DN18459_c0_g1_i1.p1  ORF type:complete len:289 (+),score=62.00 TRINITY_DN18459_c0_g1_i1:54-869(+)
MSSTAKIGFLGGGQMAEAMTRGFLSKGFAAASDIFVSDVAEAQLARLQKELGVNTGKDNRAASRFANILILAVKPNNVEAVLTEIKPDLTANHLLVSICAGVTLSTLHTLTEGSSCRLVRVMPNTPCLVGLAASAFCLGPNTVPADADTMGKLLSAVGIHFQLDEKLLDAVTGLSGSGPAYVYMFIEAMADGGVRAGLPRDVAQALAAQTVLGSAQMVLNGRHPGQLKDAVCSPGGTTIEGVAALEAGGMRSAVIQAVSAAAKRSAELGKK